MVNKITNTPIVAQHYGSLSLRQMRHQSHGNCIVQSDGTLWTCTILAGGIINVYKSADNGFSWTLEIETDQYNQRDSAGGSAKGPLVYLVLEELYRNLDILSVEWEGVGPSWLVNRERFDLDDLSTTSEKTAGIIDYNNSNGVIDFSFNHRNGVLVFNDGSSNLGAMLLSPRSTAYSAEIDLADSVGSGPGPVVVVDDAGKAYCAYVKSAINALRFALFTTSASGGAWGTPVNIVADLGDTDAWPDDLVIARDGYGTLCVAFANHDRSANTMVLTYATSIDSGANWDVNTISRETGYSVYVEPTNTEETMYIDLIAGISGFILTYCEKEDDDTNGHTFVRQLTTSDSGATYDIQAQKEIGTRYDGQDVVGGHFFKAPDIKLMDFSDPGLVRLGYTVGEGDHDEGTDDLVSVTLAQELLSEVAFPSILTTDTGTYTQDTAASNELLVSFVIVGSPQDNLDFYAAGMIGTQTKKYLAAFKKIGTNGRILRYEPDAANFMNNISAYSAPTESRTFILFDPISYAFPTPEIAATGSEAWIQRDVRKIYLPPDFHLARTFVTNKGGYLKRTVWLIEHDGNQYELSQVVPRFISNQICYYEANAFVVGPSRDPWSRTVLPSET